MSRLRHRWNAREDRLLREFYPGAPTAMLADELGLRVRQVYERARTLGLKKSAAFFAQDWAGRIQRGQQDPRMRATQFKPGLVPWNKGTHYVAGGRSAETRFKKGARLGAAARNYKPIGTQRISYDGLLYQKVTDDPALVPARRWKSVQELVWRRDVGRIPRGHVVVFRPGQHTVIEAEITTDRLECISRAELMRRNSVHARYPKDVAELIQLRGALKRKINNRKQRNEEQDERRA